MRSIINDIPGYPCDGRGERLYMLTSWSRDGIKAAREKVHEVTDDPISIHIHYGENGMHGDEWFSFTATMPVLDADQRKGERIADRYGLLRWVWTEDEFQHFDNDDSVDPDDFVYEDGRPVARITDADDAQEDAADAARSTQEKLIQ